MANTEENWVTINGTHILLKGGESPKEAIERKFGDSRPRGSKNKSKTMQTTKKTSKTHAKIKATYEKNKSRLDAATKNYEDVGVAYRAAGDEWQKLVDAAVAEDNRMFAEYPGDATWSSFDHKSPMWEKVYDAETKFGILQKEINEAGRRKDNMRGIIRAEAKGHLFSETETSSAKQKIGLSVSETQKPSINIGVSRFNQLVTNTKISESEIYFVEDPGTRARAGRNGITLGGNDDQAIVIHEMGHILEARDPIIHERAIAFLNKRTQGETAIKMNAAMGKGFKGYDDDEITRPSKFIDPYMGKDYGGTATEIVSMGLQTMYERPVEFALKDPEYFDFMIEITRGTT